jgi:DNA-binding GntR family transcriptional regulator
MRLSVARSTCTDIVRRIDIHEEILAALEAGNGTEAGRLLREHSESIGALWQQRVLANEQLLCLQAPG